MNKRWLEVLAWLLIFNVIVSTSWASMWSLGNTVGPLGGGGLTYSIASPDGEEATLTFDLLGYGSIDGNNRHADPFRLTINGVTVFAGGFNMGGGGDPFVTTAEGVTVVSTVSHGPNEGGMTRFRVAFPLLAGTNTLRFDYGTGQALADEGWGLQDLTVTVDASSLPQPTTMLLLGVGVLVLGGLRVVRKKV